MSLSRLTGLAATAVAGVTLTVALTAQGPAAPKTYKFSAAELATPSEHHQNPAKLVPRPEGASLSLPPGFTATLFASGGFKRPRNVAQAPNGDIFVVDSGPGTIWVLRDADKNGTIEDSERSEFATGLKQPFGIAFTKGAVYVAATDQVVKYPVRGRRPEGHRRRHHGDAAAQRPDRPLDAQHRVRARRPQLLRDRRLVGQHRRRSRSAARHGAQVQRRRHGPDDGAHRRAQRPGLAFNPTTREAWITVQERDGLGDDLVHDYLAKVVPGRFYGWPYAYLGRARGPAARRQDARSRQEGRRARSCSSSRTRRR